MFGWAVAIGSAATVVAYIIGGLLSLAVLGYPVEVGIRRVVALTETFLHLGHSRGRHYWRPSGRHRAGYVRAKWGQA